MNNSNNNIIEQVNDDLDDSDQFIETIATGLIEVIDNQIDLKTEVDINQAINTYESQIQETINDAYEMLLMNNDIQSKILPSIIDYNMKEIDNLFLTITKLEKNVIPLLNEDLDKIGVAINELETKVDRIRKQTPITPVAAISPTPAIMKSFWDSVTNLSANTSAFHPIDSPPSNSKSNRSSSSTAAASVFANLSISPISSPASSPRVVITKQPRETKHPQFINKQNQSSPVVVSGNVMKLVNPNNSAITATAIPSPKLTEAVDEGLKTSNNSSVFNLNLHNSSDLISELSSTSNSSPTVLQGRKYI